MTPEETLNLVGPGLAEALKPDAPLNLTVREAARHGFYGFTVYKEGPKAGQMVDDWFEFAKLIGRTLYAIHPYSFLDLGCNVGMKSPIFAGWGCERYLGVDQMPEAIMFAQGRWTSSVVNFQVLDVVRDEWPTGFTAMGMTYVFQHIPLDAKRIVLAKVLKAAPLAFIMADRCLRHGTLADCAKEHEATWSGSKQIPYPISELVERLPGYHVVQPTENLFICQKV